MVSAVVRRVVRIQQSGNSECGTQVIVEVEQSGHSDCSTQDAFSKQYFPPIKVPFQPSCGCFDFETFGFYKWGDCDCNEQLPFVCEKQKTGGSCPSGWTDLSPLNECIKSETVNYTFDRAIQECQNQGGIMLTLRKPQKYEAVRCSLFFHSTNMSEGFFEIFVDAFCKRVCFLSVHFASCLCTASSALYQKQQSQSDCLVFVKPGYELTAPCSEKLQFTCLKQEPLAKASISIITQRPSQTLRISDNVLFACTPPSPTISCQDYAGVMSSYHDRQYAFCRNNNPHGYSVCGKLKQSSKYKWCARVALAVKGPPKLTSNIDNTNHTAEVGTNLTATCQVFPVKNDPVLVWIMYSKDDIIGRSLKADDDKIISYNANAGVLPYYKSYLIVLANPPVTKLSNGSDIIISELQVKVTASMGGASVGCYAYNISKYGNNFSCFQNDIFCARSLPLKDENFEVPYVYLAISIPILAVAGVAMYLLLTHGDEEIAPPPEGEARADKKKDGKNVPQTQDSTFRPGPGAVLGPNWHLRTASGLEGCKGGEALVENGYNMISGSRLLAYAGETRLSEEAGEIRLGAEAGETRLGVEVGRSRLLAYAGETRLSEEAGEIRLGAEAGESRLSEEAGRSRLLAEAGESRLSEEAGETRLSEEAGESRLSEEAGETSLLAEAGQTKLGAEANATRLVAEAGRSRMLAEAGESRLGAEAGKSRLLAEAGEFIYGAEAGRSRLLAEVGESRLSEEAGESRLSEEAGESRLSEEAGETSLLAELVNPG
ncbi:collagen triple helix repeat-containing protein [Plakobranchus ocellatus]|uniref:Collagen triple helix repeat-containing protein n=1 Tax=Plakobranchus ocellatus TaxID=259542 RepID=A0AAV4CT71_9GAST|nr:collagen triple helix repeat-containing protein [Plakobranchus ocellatus]